jgi:hypothetical protein
VGQLASISVKALALSVLAASKPVPAHRSVGTVNGTLGTGLENTRALAEEEQEPRHTAQLALCGSPNCGGCYDVGDGRKIHLPKASPEWLAWLERCKPKGPVQ